LLSKITVQIAPFLLYFDSSSEFHHANKSKIMLS
jgi:hypothetical protein